MDKICHFLNNSKYSGAENVVVTIGRLDENNKHVFVSPDGPVTNIVEERGIRHLSVEGSDLSIKEMMKVILTERPTVVQLHDFRASIKGAIISSWMKRHGVRRIISHLHKNDPRMKKFGLTSLLYLVALLTFDKVILVSDSVEREYIFRALLKKKSIILPNVVDREWILESANSQNVDETGILFLGRLTELKNPLGFVSFIKQLHDVDESVHATMVGSGPLKYEVERIISENNLPIQMVGFTTNPYPYLKNADCMIIPSKWEGFGLVALESLVLHVPVLANRVGGLSTLLSNEKVSYLFEENLTVEEFGRFRSKQIKNLDFEDFLLKKNNVNNYKTVLQNIYQEK
ncbi:glycosyltransferase [Weissella cibaria]|uniref:glycosyltransferase n=1 Tax=Weissella cibaria TaxID=137591 RepID=UPI001E623984|nr:glycosyltransferase [Weissella cibaria]MCC6122200.1 glycosyltransferase [Weissella cibaria]